jgi:hypothetical protein
VTVNFESSWMLVEVCTYVCTKPLIEWMDLGWKKLEEARSWGSLSPYKQVCQRTHANLSHYEVMIFKIGRLKILWWTLVLAFIYLHIWHVNLQLYFFPGPIYQGRKWCLHSFCQHLEVCLLTITTNHNSFLTHCVKNSITCLL